MMLKPFVKCGKLWVTIKGKAFRAVIPYRKDECSYFILCPLCGEPHSHGLQPGLRYSHCERIDGSYYIHVPKLKEVN